MFFTELIIQNTSTNSQKIKINHKTNNHWQLHMRIINYKSYSLSKYKIGLDINYFFLYSLSSFFSAVFILDLLYLNI